MLQPPQDRQLLQRLGLVVRGLGAVLELHELRAVHGVRRQVLPDLDLRTRVLGGLAV